MNLIKKSFFSHSKNYLVADLFNNGIAFLTVPIFTRLLLPEEYGILAIVTSAISIFTILIGMNFNGAINRKYLEFDGEFEDFLGTNLLFLFLINIIFLYIGYLFRKYLAILFSIDESLIIIALLISSFGFYVQIELSYLQASQQSGKYTQLSVTRTLITTTIAIIWTYYLRENRFLGKLYSQILITAIFAIFVILNLIKLSKFNFKKRYIKYSLLFGIPLIPHALSGFILAQFDRIIINQISGSYDTGLYSFAYNVGMIMMITVGAIGNAQGPITMKLYKDKKIKEIQRLIDNSSKVIFFIAFILILFSKELVMVMASEKYLDSLSIIPIIVISYVMTYLYGLYIFFPFLYKKTFRISIFTFIAGFANIGLNYLFIPKYGYVAAAWTTLVSYILLFLLHYFNTIYLMKEKIISFTPILKNFLLLIILTVFYLQLENINIFIDIVLKIIIAISFALFLKLKVAVNELKR